MSELISVPFHNHSLSTALVNSIPYVAMKPICENIGLDWRAQYNRIKRHPVLNSVVAMTTTTGKDKKSYDMLMLPLKMLNGWLFGVDVYRVKPEIKEKLIQYQKECFDVLSDHFIQKRNGLLSLSQPVNLMPNPHRFLITLDANSEYNQVIPMPYASSIVNQHNIEEVIGFIKPGYMLVKTQHIDAIESEVKCILK